ncbi:MAG: DivIVA domain-containing protein [Lachnospiraceae bacterium]|nr:DivIVA domain-containing protein [Lachnospiraceae bacterium]
MLSLNEIKNHEFKKGIGYTKKSVDDFVNEIVESFEEVNRENAELKEKLTTLSEGIQYYKSIEKTLQKSLVLAQKTADEKKEKALNNAKIIEKVARSRADSIITKAKNDLDAIYRQTDELNRRFELYKSYVKNLITTQLDLINSDTYKISVNDLDGYLKLKDELEDARNAIPEEEDNTSEVDENIADFLSDKETADDEEAVEKDEFEAVMEKIKEEDVDHVPELKHKTATKPVQEAKPASAGTPVQGVKQMTSAKPMQEAKKASDVKPVQENTAAKAVPTQEIKPVKVPKITPSAKPVQGAKPASESAPVSDARHFAETRTIQGVRTADDKHLHESKPVTDVSPASELKAAAEEVHPHESVPTAVEMLSSAAKSQSAGNLRAGEMNAQERRVLLAKKIAAEEKTREEIDRMQNLREQSTSVNDNLINRIPRDILGADDEIL